MTTLVVIAAICILIQVYYWYFVFRLASRKIPITRREYETIPPGFSVVVCFHKPWDGIPVVLQSLSRQSYLNYEVVLVNDGPVNMDSDILESYLKANDFVHYIEHYKTSPGKKNALFTGTMAARQNWIVVTDIDCQPGQHWLTTLAAYIPSQSAIVLGYSPYHHRSGLLNFIIQQETLLTVFQYMGWAQAGHPYMGVGRNMAGHKSIYEEVTFDSHAHIPTGDDDLFVNEAAGKFPVYICNDRAGFVYSYPATSWKAWYRQKTRHNSGGKYYSRASKIRLAVFILALSIEKIILTYLLVCRIDLFFIFLTIKVIVTIGPLRKLYRKFDQESNFWKMWFYEWIHVIYLILLTPYIFFKTRKQWD